LGLLIGLSIAAIIQVIQMFALIIVQQNRTFLERPGSLVRFLYVSAQYIFSNWVSFSVVLIVLSVIGCLAAILRNSTKKRHTLVTAILLLVNLFLIGQWYDAQMVADHLLYLQNHIKSLIVFLFGITILFLYVWGIKRIMKEKKDFVVDFCFPLCGIVYVLYPVYADWIAAPVNEQFFCIGAPAFSQFYPLCQVVPCLWAGKVNQPLFAPFSVDQDGSILCNNISHFYRCCFSNTNPSADENIQQSKVS